MLQPSISGKKLQWLLKMWNPKMVIGQFVSFPKISLTTNIKDRISWKLLSIILLWIPGHFPGKYAVLNINHTLHGTLLAKNSFAFDSFVHQLNIMNRETFSVSSKKHPVVGTMEISGQQEYAIVYNVMSLCYVCYSSVGNVSFIAKPHPSQILLYNGIQKTWIALIW